MFCSLMKGVVQHSQQPHLLTTIAIESLIKETIEISLSFYSNQHPFFHLYLSHLYQPKNMQLIQDGKWFISHINSQGLQPHQYDSCLQQWLRNQHSPIYVLIYLWKCFLEYQIRLKQQPHQFFVDEIEQFGKMVLSVIKIIYPNFHGQKNFTKFNFHLLDYLSQGSLFQKVMATYLKKFNKKTGIGGQFTASQISLTAGQVQDLIKLDKIEKPFARSILMIQLFHIEHNLSKKIRYLIETVHEIKEEIREYRQNFRLGPAIIGFDQLFPLVCFVCERSNQNILASTHYLNAFLGRSVQSKEKLLKVASSQAFYSIQLMESASSFYCHTSQFIDK